MTSSWFIATSFNMCYKWRISTKTCINTEELMYLVSVGLKCFLLCFADGKITSRWFQELIKILVQIRDSNSVPNSVQSQFTTIPFPQMLRKENGHGKQRSKRMADTTVGHLWSVKDTWWPQLTAFKGKFIMLPKARETKDPGRVPVLTCFPSFITSSTLISGVLVWKTNYIGRQSKIVLHHL